MRKSELGTRLDQTLGSVRFTPEMEQAVLRRAEGPQRRPLLRRGAAAALLCGALVTAALAAGPGIWAAIRAHLGEQAPYAAQPAVTASDQGIELGVAAALADRNMVRVYVTLRDLEGDRLAGRVKLDLRPQARDEAGKLIPDPTAPALGTLAEVVDYDEETGTIILCQTYYRQFPREDLDLSVTEIIPGFQSFYLGLSGDRLAAAVPEEILESAVGPDGCRYLLPGQNPMEMDWEKCPLPEGAEPGISVSSFGYAGDGRLHVRFRVEEGVRLTGMDLPPFGDWEMELMAELPDGLDYAFPAGCPGREELKDSTVFFFTGDYSTREGPIEGSWSVNVPLELVESVKLEWTGGDIPDPAGFRGAVKVEGLWLSPLGLSAQCLAEDGAAFLRSEKAVLTLRDGSRRETEPGALAVGLGDLGDAQLSLIWALNEPVEPEEVASVTFCGQTVEVPS